MSTGGQAASSRDRGSFQLDNKAPETMQVSSQEQSIQEPDRGSEAILDRQETRRHQELAEKLLPWLAGSWSENTGSRQDGRASRAVLLNHTLDKLRR
jgi:hypothetical protein